MINYEDFKRIDLRVARICAAERIEGSEKLLRLQIDLGGEQRQLVSGIAKTYSPEELVGKEIIIVANLEPRQIMGLESQGMLLAGDHAGPVLLVPEKELPPGMEIC